MDLAPSRSGDQVARDHEEDVHPDVPARHRSDMGVVEHDGEDGDGRGLQALDVLADTRLRGPGRYQVSVWPHLLSTPIGTPRGT